MIGALVTELASATTCEEFRRATVAYARPGLSAAVTLDEFDNGWSWLACASSVPRLEVNDAVLERLMWNERLPTLLESEWQHTAPPVAVSDAIDRAGFRESALYQSIYSELGIEDEVVMVIPGVAGPATLRLAQRAWGVDEETRAHALEVQCVLSAMCAVRRDRAAVQAAGPVAQKLAEESGRFVLVSDRAGALFNLDGSTSDVGGPLASLIQSAVAVAMADLRTAAPGEPIVEHTALAENGSPMSVQVLAPSDGSRLLPILVQRGRLSVTSEDLCRHGLTSRQSEVMALILDGATNGGVAHRLGISERTVEKHVYGAYARLGARTRTEALLTLLR